MRTAPARVNEYTKLSVPKKIGYACGDFACNMSWSLIGSYLVFFLTDVALINATTVGLVIFVSKFWDAINDPVIGSLADRTHTRWGRYRPWVMFAFAPMLVFNVLTFTTNLEWSETVRTVWGLGMYFILVLVYTMVNVTYSAMPAMMTRDTETRSALSSYRMTGAFLAMTVLSFATLRIVNAMGGGVAGYRNAALVFSLMAMPFFLITIFSTKEVVTVDDEKVEKVSFISQFKVLSGNWPVIQIAIAYLGWGVIQGGMTFRLYFCTYNAGSDLLYANTQTLWSIMGMLGAFSVSYHPREQQGDARRHRVFADRGLLDHLPVPADHHADRPGDLLCDERGRRLRLRHDAGQCVRDDAGYGGIYVPQNRHLLRGLPVHRHQLHAQGRPGRLDCGCGGAAGRVGLCRGRGAKPDGAVRHEFRRAHVYRHLLDYLRHCAVCI